MNSLLTGKARLIASSDSISVNEDDHANIILLLESPAKTAMTLQWKILSPSGRWVAEHGTILVAQNSNTAQFRIDSLANTTLEDSAEFSLVISSAQVASDVTIDLNLVDSTRPAQLNVTGGTTQNFGTIQTSTVSSLVVHITNTGDVPAVLSATTNPSSPFSYKDGTFPGTGGTCTSPWPAGVGCDVVFEFSPIADGVFSSSTTIPFNNGLSSQNLVINLNGASNTVAASFLSGQPNAEDLITTLNVTVGGSGITQYRSKVVAGTDCTSSSGYSAATPVATPITTNISALPDGVVTLCAVGSNGTDWQPFATPTFHSWIKDTLAPTSPLISIEAGQSFVTSTSVTLSLSAIGASQMYVTNNSSCTSGGTLEAYTTTKAWTLPSSNSTNTVYVRYIDAAGNSVCVNDAIVHDNQAPNTLSGITLGTVPASLTQSPTLSFAAATDNGPSGINQVEVQVIRVSDSAVVKAWGAISSGASISSLSLTQGVSYRADFRVSDNAGNISATSSSGTWVAFNTLAATLTGTPSSPSSATSLNVTIGGTAITHYAYKVGAGADCTNATGYSSATPIATLITDSITALTDGSLTLCVIGSNGSSWQTYASATSATWVKDTTAPTSPSIVINSGDGYTSSLISNLTLSAASATQMYITETAGCATGGAWEGYSTSKLGYVMGSANATNTVYVKFRDAALNESTCASDTIVHDNQTPNVVASVNTSSATTSLTQTPTLTFTNGIDIGPAGIDYTEARLVKVSDSSEIRPYTTVVAPTSFTGLSLSQGDDYRFELRSYDRAGNVSGVSWSSSFTASASMTTTLSGQPTGTNNATVLNVTVSGPGLVDYKYKFGDSGLDCTSPAGYQLRGSTGSLNVFIGGASDGPMKICVIGYNGIVWQDESLATTASWIKDTSAPTSPLVNINSSDLYTTSSSVSLSLSAVDATEMYVTETAGCASGGAWEPYNTSKAVTLTQLNTSANIYVRFRDSAGNVSSCVNDDIVHDNTAPSNVGAIALGAVPGNLSNTPILTYSASTESGSGIAQYEVRVHRASDNAVISPYQSHTSGTSVGGLTLVDAAQYYVVVRAVDHAGNISSESTSANWTTNGALSVTFAGTPSNPSNATSLNISLSGSGVSEYRFKVGPAASTDCNDSSGYSSITPLSTNITNSINIIPDGPISLCAIGGDGLGNWQAYSSASSYTWTKDTGAPTGAMLSIASGAAYTTTSSITLTLTATGATQIYISNSAGCAAGGAWEPYTTSKAWLLGQANSTATVYAKYRDAALNETGCVTDTIVHDDVVPSVGSSLALGTVSNKLFETPTLTFTSGSDAGSGLKEHQVALLRTSDNAIVSPYQVFTSGSKLSSVSLVNGSQYYFRLKSIDNALNESTEVSSGSFTASAPTATLSGTPADPSSTPTLNVTVGGSDITHYRYKIGLSNATDCTSSSGYSGSGIAIATLITDTIGSDGTYRLCVVGSNGIDWQPFASATAYTWTKDTAGPAMPTLSINAGALYTTNAVVTLGISAIDANQMYITQAAGCISGGAWEGYVISKSWNLTTTNSINTVYIKFRDTLNNESSCVSAIITHDNQSPNVPTDLSLDVTPLGVNETPWLYATAASDNGPSGIDYHQYRLIRTSDSSQIVAWQTYNAGTGGHFSSLSLTDNTEYRYEVRAYDRAGNVSPVVQSPTFTTYTALTAVIDTLPTNPSQTTILNIQVSGNGVFQYRYKIQNGTNSICSSAAGYSSNIGIATRITDSISGLSDGSVTVCVVGYNGSVYQSFASATSYTWVKDTAAPVLNSISTASGNGPFRTGQTISFTLTFSEATTLSATANARLHLDLQSGQIATYSSGQGTSSMTFAYTVQAGDNTSDLATLAPHFSMSSGTIADSLGNSATSRTPTTSLVSSSDIVVDTTPPTGQTVTIAAGAAYATSTSTTLTISGTGATEMYLTSTAGCASGGVWETFATSKAYTLATVDGTKIVYMKLRDSAGNESSCVSDSIILDTTQPTVSIAYAGGQAATTSNFPINFTATLSEDVNDSSISGATISQSGTAAGVNWSISKITETTYTISATSATSAGTIRPTFSANAFTDLAGLNNTASTGTDAVTYTIKTFPLRFLQVAAGQSHTCALSLGGDVYCWGEKSQRAVGDGVDTATDVGNPVLIDTSTITGSKKFVYVSVGGFNSCAIAADGKAYCWGSNGSNQVGDGVSTTAMRIRPTLVDTSGMSGSKIFKSISINFNHACGVAADGLGYCWGSDANGRLGRNLGTGSVNKPTAVVTSGISTARTFQHIEAGSIHSCGLMTDGEIYCWGGNNVSQAGSGNATSQFNAPNRVVGGHKWIALSVGNETNCAIKSDGAAYCWGLGNTGGLGTGNTTSQNTPTAVLTTNVANASEVRMIQISAGTQNGCMLASDGKLYCWGDNGAGMAGDNTTGNSKPTPVAVLLTNLTSPNQQFTKFDVGADHVCGISADRQLYCWGYAASKQLGNNSTTDRYLPVLTSLSGATQEAAFIDIASAGSNSCGVVFDGRVFCWGDNAQSSVGDGSTTNAFLPVAVDTSAMSGATRFRSLFVSPNGEVFGIATDGLPYAWGNGSNNLLGMGSYSNVNKPTVMNSVWSMGWITTSKYARSIFSTGTTTCLTMVDSKAYCLGSYTGNSTNPNVLYPVAVDTSQMSDNTDIWSIAGYGTNKCAINAAGKLYCWGANGSGELGNGTSTASQIPVATTLSSVTGAQTALQSAHSNTSSCAVFSDGKVYCWGLNSYGVLGNSSASSNPLTPYAIVTTNLGTENHILSLNHSVAAYQMYARSGDNRSFFWGDNSNAQGDLSSMGSFDTPTAMRTSSYGANFQLRNYSVGSQHACSVTVEGKGFCVGTNTAGQCGVTGTVTSPTQINLSNIN